MLGQWHAVGHQGRPDTASFRDGSLPDTRISNCPPQRWTGAGGETRTAVCGAGCGRSSGTSMRGFHEQCCCDRSTRLSLLEIGRRKIAVALPVRPFHTGMFGVYPTPQSTCERVQRSEPSIDRSATSAFVRSPGSRCPRRVWHRGTLADHVLVSSSQFGSAAKNASEISVEWHPSSRSRSTSSLAGSGSTVRQGWVPCGGDTTAV